MLALDQGLGYRVRPLTSRHYDDIADARLEQNRGIIHTHKKKSRLGKMGETEN